MKVDGGSPTTSRSALYAARSTWGLFLQGGQPQIEDACAFSCTNLGESSPLSAPTAAVGHKRSPLPLSNGVALGRALYWTSSVSTMSPLRFSTAVGRLRLVTSTSSWQQCCRIDRLLARPSFDQTSVHAENVHPTTGRWSVPAFSAISPFGDRSRFLLKTLGTHTCSSMFRPTKQRNSRCTSSRNSFPARSRASPIDVWSPKRPTGYFSSHNSKTSNCFFVFDRHYSTRYLFSTLLKSHL
jgi:hypothetical protein